MKVFLYEIKRYMLDTTDNVETVATDLVDVPQDVLDRHEKAMLEFEAVQRILKLYRNGYEG